MNRTSNIKNSIASKISFKVVLETISSYILINLVIITMVMSYLYYYEKKNVETLVNMYKADKIEENIDIVKAFGYELEHSKEKPFVISGDYDYHIFSMIETVRYNFVIEDNLSKDEDYMYISKLMYKEFAMIINGMMIILCIQIFSVFVDFSKNRRMIRETMRPLDDLAKATRVINKATNMSPESLRKIAGALDGINAEHLETRLPVETAKAELKSLTVAINGMLDRLDKSYKSQARFVSDASHELRTPIAVIQSYSSLLDRWGIEDQKTAEEAVRAIKSEAEAMKIMVEQLLFLARGDNDSMHFQISQIDIGELAEQTLNEIKMIDKNHQFSLEKDKNCITSVDIGLIKQLMRILMDNSIKYTEVGGIISVKVYKENSNIVFSIQDEGQGIGPDEVENIFDRFYRTDKSRNRNTGGSGLGLSIGRWIVEKHNGSISVLSREGLGTRIIVKLPTLVNEEHICKDLEVDIKN
ncbi:MAG: sensor histidine kinase [Filifactoraceae bacterium]